MLRYVFKPKGSRVYRGRYRLGDNPVRFDVSLHTDKKHVAEATLRKLADEEEMAQLGLGPAKGLRDAAKSGLAEHVNDFLADLKARQRGKIYLEHTRTRLRKLGSACGWNRLTEITADTFLQWRASQQLSPDTLNHYLGHANAFLNWAVKNGRLTANPLRVVGKVETRGHERCVRRALTDAELTKLVQSSGSRGLVYLLAAYTGLRRGEIRKLVWEDLHLDGPHPYIEARASTTKNKTRAVIPLVPVLAEALREKFTRRAPAFPRVFPDGIPSAKKLAKDLTACRIPVIDALGRRVDFHALRHTYATILAQAGIPRRVAMELMRHSDSRLTDKVYVDTTSFSLFGVVTKLDPPSLSPLASPNAGKSCPKSAKPGKTLASESEAEIAVIADGRTDLAKAVPSWDSPAMASPRGFEPGMSFMDGQSKRSGNLSRLFTYEIPD